MDERQDDRELVEEEGLHRAFDELEGHQAVIHEALDAEDRQPAHRPNQITRPERHHDQDEERGAETARAPGEEIGEGIAHEQADRGDRDRQANGPQQQIREHGVAPEVQVVVPREVGNDAEERRAVERHHDQHGDRDDEIERQEQAGRHEEEQDLDPAPPVQQREEVSPRRAADARRHRRACRGALYRHATRSGAGSSSSAGSRRGPTSDRMSAAPRLQQR